MKMRQRLVSGARCAIKMRSKEPDRKKAIKLLERDLINGPLGLTLLPRARMREQGVM